MFCSSKTKVVIFLCLSFACISFIDATGENQDNFSKEKKTITPEERIRRRKIFEKYLVDNYEDQSSWIDVHSESFWPRKQALNGMLSQSYTHDNTNLNLKREISNEKVEISIENQIVSEKADEKPMESDNVINNNWVLEGNMPNNDMSYGTLFGRVSKPTNKGFLPFCNKETPYIEFLNKDETVSTNTKYIIKEFSDLNKISSDCVDAKVHSKKLLKERMQKSSRSEFVKTPDNWVETYNFILKPNEDNKHVNYKSIPVSDSEHSSLNRNVRSEYSVKKAESMVLDCVREKLYFSRWLKKLVTKLENAEAISITVSFNSESINQLKLLASSDKFSTDTADEVFSNLIFNAYVNKSHDWVQYIPSYTFILYAIIVIASMLLFYSVRHRPLLFLMLFLFAVFMSAIIMNYYKMYQRKIAEKEHVISSISSIHCKSLLTPNSGIYDHIKESFRHLYHHEDCKKYYDSVIVDSAYEINLILVVTDMVWNALLQVLCVLAETLNYCVKAAFSNTFLYQKVIILTLFVFIILLVFKYKIKLSFITLEPSIPVGSRVEDLTSRNTLFSYLFCRNSRTVPLNNHYDLNSEINASSAQDQLCGINSNPNSLKMQELYEKMDHESRLQINYVDKKINSELNSLENTIPTEFMGSKTINSDIEQTCVQINHTKHIKYLEEITLQDSKILYSDMKVINGKSNYDKSAIEHTSDTQAINSETFPEKSESVDIPDVKANNILLSNGVDKSDVKPKCEVNFGTIKRKLDMLMSLVEETVESGAET